MHLKKIILLLALCIGCACHADAFPSGMIAEHSAMDMEHGRGYYSRSGDARAYVEPISDPLEPMNRTFHGLNKYLVDYLVYNVKTIDVSTLPTGHSLYWSWMDDVAFLDVIPTPQGGN